MRQTGGTLRALALLAIINGCSEYQVESNLPPVGQYNPRAVDTPIVHDVLVQANVPRVDTLFVVDNSSSMANNQAALTDAFPAFVDFFVGSGLDYHIGVVSTDVYDPNHMGKLRISGGEKYITDSTPDPIGAFFQMASMGVNGSGAESGRAAAYEALVIEAAGYNAGYRRNDASLHIVVISDENDSSTDDPVSKQEFIDWMLGQQRPNQDATFNAIVNEADCCGLFSQESPGTKYVQVALAVGGIVHDIQTSDWDTVLNELGLQASGMKREYFLSELPVPETIDVVVVDGGISYTMIEDVDWVYDAPRNSVLFLDFLPNSLSEIQITYQKLSDVQ